MGIPPIPAVSGPLEIRVVHPTPAVPRPRVDSTFIYGSVGTGEAALRINGTEVEVAPNGAFLAFVPVPADGRYELVAQARGQTAQAVAAYRAPAPAPAQRAPAPTTVTFPQPRAGTVTGQRGDQLRVRLDSATTAWFPASTITLSGTPVPAGLRRVGRTVARSGPDWTEVRIPMAGAPFLVRADSGFAVTLYGVSAPAPETAVEAAGDPLLAGGSWSAPAPGVARLNLQLKQPLWGYKAFYDAEGALVLRLRRPPTIDPAQPLRGIRIVVDPGHPPAGATGPTGLTEAEANLPIALRLAERLRAGGAEVFLTRTDNTPVSLTDRVGLAVSRDAHLLVSVHNNAFAEGANPFRRQGTSTYYFHPHAAELARALNREIVGFTRIRDIGALQGNLALVRPTWMPTALTESMFMLIPEHEAALRSPGFADRLAAAHARGIEAFLRSHAR